MLAPPNGSKGTEFLQLFELSTPPRRLGAPDVLHDHHANPGQHPTEPNTPIKPKHISFAEPLNDAGRQASLSDTKPAYKCGSVCCDLMCHAMAVSAGPYFLLPALVRAAPRAFAPSRLQTV
jgi:hypothetical protein